MKEILTTLAELLIVLTIWWTVVCRFLKGTDWKNRRPPVL